MSEPQPREQPQQPAQQPQNQNRTRNRLSADIQTPRRPRAVAGQRAAAKRAAQSPPRPRTAPETSTPAAPSTSTATLVALPDSIAPESPKPNPSPRPRFRSASRPASGPSSRSASDPTSRRALVTAVLAIAVLAVIVIGAILGLQYRNGTRTNDARTAAMAAAEKAAPVIFSYDYRHLDQDFAKAEAFLTGAFRDQYTKTTQTVVKPTALQYQGVVQAVVAKPTNGGAPAVSVVSASPDQVVVLAFIDQSTTSTRVNGTQVDQNRVLLTLTNTPRGWLVSAVDAL